MSYPSELLPQVGYKERINTDWLPREATLIRRAITSEDNTFNAKGDIRIDALFLSPEHCLAYSCNLLGVFQVDHIIFKPGRNSKWNTAIELPNPNDIPYSFYEHCYPLFIDVSKLHQKPINYSKIINQKSTKFNGRILVDHEPTVSNYWHFEVHVIDEDGKIIEQKSNNWRKRLGEDLASSMFKKHAYTLRNSIPPLYTIEERVYIDIL